MSTQAAMSIGETTAQISALAKDALQPFRNGEATAHNVQHLRDLIGRLTRLREQVEVCADAAESGAEALERAIAKTGLQGELVEPFLIIEADAHAVSLALKEWAADWLEVEQALQVVVEARGLSQGRG